MTLKETILKEALEIFKRQGLEEVSEAAMMQKLDISQATFREIFSGLDDMVTQVIAYDAQVQEARHKQLLSESGSAVEDIMILLQDGIEELQQTNPALYAQLQQRYPAAWALAQSRLDTYSHPQISGILNKGVLEGNFRRDINIQVVTKIILAQLVMMLNPQVFPPDRFNLAEVFRSIYLYYIRGICTDAGSRLAEAFFSRSSN
ncbi:MAG: TetR/AcrR family transcriptional regulator [Adhaeribacter sp.]